MEGFHEIAAEELGGNVFDLIGKKWMLVAAGRAEKFNMMTASWGGLGVIWGKPAAFVFIRPQRYTLEFVNREERFSLNFFDEEWRGALNFCGSKSGRNHDKAKETGLTPVADGSAVWFEQAKIVLVCKKLYTAQFDPAGFLDPTVDRANYPGGDYHHVFVGAIEKVLTK